MCKHDWSTGVARFENNVEIKPHLDTLQKGVAFEPIISHLLAFFRRSSFFQNFRRRYDPMSTSAHQLSKDPHGHVLCLLVCTSVGIINLQPSGHEFHGVPVPSRSCEFQSQASSSWTAASKAAPALWRASVRLSQSFTQMASVACRYASF